MMACVHILNEIFIILVMNSVCVVIIFYARNKFNFVTINVFLASKGHIFIVSKSCMYMAKNIITIQ